MPTTTSKILIQLKKAKSNLEHIIGMLKNKKYCIDIIQQNLAVIGLLKSTNLALLENHLHTCFLHTWQSKNEEEFHQMINELIKIIQTAQNK